MNKDRKPQLNDEVSVIVYQALTPPQMFNMGAGSEMDHIQRAKWEATSELDNVLRICWCFRCLDEPSMGPLNPAVQRMIVCPQCGNKRCPRATSHDNACSGSNEPGQDGSRYK